MAPESNPDIKRRISNTASPYVPHLFRYADAMGSKRFDTLSDFSRWGMNIRLECGNGRCDHFGILDAWQASTYFRLHRWPEFLEPALGQSALFHFRCTRCGHKAGRARPDANAVTVTDFFPADDRGWQMLQRRLRG